MGNTAQRYDAVNDDVEERDDTTYGYCLLCGDILALDAPSTKVIVDSKQQRFAAHQYCIAQNSKRINMLYFKKTRILGRNVGTDPEFVWLNRLTKGRMICKRRDKVRGPRIILRDIYRPMLLERLENKNAMMLNQPNNAILKLASGDVIEISFV